MAGKPLYESRGSFKSLGQVYQVFSDRFELRTLLGTWCIPFREVEVIELHEARLQALLNGRLDLWRELCTLKLDCSDLTEHITLDRREGAVHRLSFSPEEPVAFFHAAQDAMATWRGAGGESGR